VLRWLVLQKVSDMEFTELIVFERKRVGSHTGATASPDCIKISLSKEKGDVSQICIRIGHSIMADMGWLAGQKASVGQCVSNGRKCLLFKLNSKGYTLSSTQGAKGKGKCIQSTLKMPYSKTLFSCCANIIGREVKPVIHNEFFVVFEE
jgi:hypothetical protein